MIGGDDNRSGSGEQLVQVEIYNQTYSIRSDGDNGYIQGLAEYVDQKMREIASGTMTVDSLKVAILASLHIADELHRTNSNHAQFDAQLASRSAECTELLDRAFKTRDLAPQELDIEQ
jgi:cell division protein ZapA